MGCHLTYCNSTLAELLKTHLPLMGKISLSWPATSLCWWNVTIEVISLFNKKTYVMHFDNSSLWSAPPTITAGFFCSLFRKKAVDFWLICQACTVIIQSLRVPIHKNIRKILYFQSWAHFFPFIYYCKTFLSNSCCIITIPTVNHIVDGMNLT